MNKLQNLLFQVYAVWCMLVPHSCENKAISAPSWAWDWAWAELGNIPPFKNVNQFDMRIFIKG